MLIKENIKDYDYSINFIDKNDNFVGFDLSQQCCEEAGWYIIREMKPYDYDMKLQELTEAELEGYYFDVDKEGAELDMDTIAFKLISDNGGVAYLHLYNQHNGYYSHGWEYSIGENKDSGCI